MRERRRLSREEAQLWAQVARTVRPLAPARVAKLPLASPVGEAAAPLAPPKAATAQKKAAKPASLVTKAAPAPQVRSLDAHGLDASWDKKLARAALHPDFTLDLHGHTLETAHARLDHGLAQAAAMGARLVLVITGRPRPSEAADRGERRGAIRAKIMDWLALGQHAGRIAAVRPAHRRHGGAGALYVILRRPK